MLFLLSSKVQKKSVLLANFGSLWNSSHVQKMESNKTKTSAAAFDCMGCPDSCGGFRKGILLKDSEGLDMQVLIPFLF